ncbi:MAG: hypothetical protein ONB44_21665 [candidate division KSB1 bacterium]|nr:hypothetical protein [candidate division KSB1 bacterium]MDZ7304745.1 hypothetical protein [candidate division KSB1 bacterium]MDZ7313848.1 hypothetical protein [candidate division KSB1 bacterium]
MAWFIFSIMLQGAGIDVIDLGINIPPEKFVEVIKEQKSAVGRNVRVSDNDDVVDEQDDGDYHRVRFAVARQNQR